MIPLKQNGVTSSFKKDAEGEVVITRMKTDILQETCIMQNINLEIYFLTQINIL